MKLRHIHIVKHKVFHDFDIDFCLGGKPQNLIVMTGVNGNGKTILFRDIISGTDVTKKPKCIITVQDDKDVRTFTLPMQTENTEYTEDFSKVRFYEAGSSSSVTQLHDAITGYVDKFVFDKGKTNFDAYLEIQRMINEAFDGLNLQIQFKGISWDKKIIFVNSKLQEFDIEGLSGGEQQILSKVFALFTDDMKGRVILIDEPESSLHPSWQTRILSILRRCAETKDCQIIVATQSPQIIASSHMEEIRLFVRNDEGYVKAEECNNNPYGWTTDKVLTEIQGVKHLRVPEIEAKLSILKILLQDNKYETEDFKEKLSELEAVLGFSDQDLILIRKEIIRKKKNA